MHGVSPAPQRPLGRPETWCAAVARGCLSRCNASSCHAAAIRVSGESHTPALTRKLGVLMQASNQQMC